MSALSSLPPLFQRFYRWVRSVLFYEHWMIGVIDQPIRNALRWSEVPPARWIESFNRQRYLADPFPWPGSEDTLLCENYDMKHHVGRIAALKLTPTADIAVEMNLVLPLPGHLSFPFLFMRDGIVYAMPESCKTGRLEIFRWQEHDGTWVSHAVVFENKPVADAILFAEDGLFWIAYTDVALGEHDNLNLAYAPRLAGPWRQHRGNPVRKGLESSRNGGGIFEVDGRLFRPAQDCSEIYGGAIRIMEILTCTTDAYQESEVTRIMPSSRIYPHGFHTLSAWGDKCLIDGARLTFSPMLLWHKVSKRLKLR